MFFEAAIDSCCDSGLCHDDNDVAVLAGKSDDSDSFFSAQVHERAKSIIEQIFGHDVLLGRKRSSRPQECIFSRLERFAHEADEKLDPCELINSTLSELVSCLQACRPESNEGAVDSFQFCQVEKQVCAFIDDNREVRRRAEMIRDVATRAESRLELFFARRLLSYDEGVNVQHSYLQRIRQAASDFPYVDNYVNMVQKEYEVLSEMLGHLAIQSSPHCIRGEQDDYVRVAFCGSGPLPLSGVLLCVYSNIHVTLIDRDEEAVAISRKLLSKWEREEIIPKNRIHIVCADAKSLSFTRSKASKQASEHCCDIVFVAALLSNTARERLVSGVEQLREDAPLVVLRSAHGLTARVAYENTGVVEGGVGGRCGGRRVALVVPETHVASDGDVVDERSGTKATHVFDAQILNSLEIFAWPRV